MTGGNTLLLSQEYPGHFEIVTFANMTSGKVTCCPG
jgi:hypothetical protein